MTIVFAAAMGHAPGMTAWPDAAQAGEREALFTAFASVRAQLAAAKVDELVLLTSEHWANFFLNHVSPFCIGRAERFRGPVEPWLRVPPADIEGDPALAAELIRACYDSDIDVGFSEELVFDHGTMVPLHFLRPENDLPVVPIFINTLAAPQPPPRRALALGRAIRPILRASPKRIGVIATGGMSHDPGERNHGVILEDFDRRFLAEMARGDLARLQSYTVADMLTAGAGAIELLSWVALAAVLERFTGEALAYEPVKAWATGIGVMVLHETRNA